MKAKDFAKQLNEQFADSDVSVGSEGESQFFKIVSEYGLELIKEFTTISQQRKAVKGPAAIAIIREQEQKYKSFYSNLSPKLKELTNLDLFKTFCYHMGKTEPFFKNLCDQVWPTKESLEKQKQLRSFGKFGF